MALEGEGFHRIAAEVPFLGDEFGPTELGNLLGAVAVDPPGGAAERVVEAEIGGEGHG